MERPQGFHERWWVLIFIVYSLLLLSVWYTVGKFARRAENEVRGGLLIRYDSARV